MCVLIFPIELYVGLKKKRFSKIPLFFRGSAGFEAMDKEDKTLERTGSKNAFQHLPCWCYFLHD